MPHISSVNVGVVDFVSAESYNHYGSTSNVVLVTDGGHYSVEARAGGRGDMDLAPALEKLNGHIAPGCMHNSADRVDAPKCHKDTRKAVQEDIFSWISHGSSDQMLWLTGPAGTGKSAIMGTVSDKLKEGGQLAATFFFSSFAGSAERQSKRGFVTTLAYQLQRYPELDDRFSPAMLTAVRRDPAVFRMSLEEQMERLILRPLRDTHRRKAPPATVPMVILVDGVDECGEDTYSSSDRRRQLDQVEVLSVLSQAAKDPTFPFRIVIASRPENWIRSFFTDSASSKVHEIFLDSKYGPDDDIRLFLKSKFAELCRRYAINTSVWPAEEVIEKLVRDASGQFIYVATVLRFIDTPPQSPQAQLEIVLKIKPHDTSKPLAVLDALYSSILMSSPSPKETVLWVKAQQLLVSVVQSGMATPISAWTIDRLFESSAGQARMLMGLPSLVYIPVASLPHPCDSLLYGRKIGVSSTLIPTVGWNDVYAFYHKSFLDYLRDPLRCGADFPGVDEGDVERWIWERFSMALTCGGPEAPIDQGLLLTFKRCFLDIFTRFLRRDRRKKPESRSDALALSKCQPSEWVTLPAIVPSTHSLTDDDFFLYDMFRIVHKRCRPYRPCNPGCKQWRMALSTLSGGRWRREQGWNSFGLILDRFCIKRV